MRGKMRKIIGISAVLFSASALADTSDVIDTIIESYATFEPIQINVYYASLSDPLHSQYMVPYENNPITLKTNNDQVHIPPKKGYFVVIKDVKTASKYTHFSTCNTYFAPIFNYANAHIDIGFPGGSIGYCGVCPSPDVMGTC